jgi:tight adherence protein C
MLELPWVNLAVQLSLAMSVFFFFLWFQPREILISSESKGHLANMKEFLRIKYPLYGVILPFVQALAPVNRKIKVGPFREQMENSLKFSGNPLAFTVDEYLAFCELFALLLPFLLSAFTFLLVGSTNFVVILVGLVIGFFLPLIWITDKKNGRLLEINRSLPYVLDLMCLAMEAGLDFNSTLQKIVSEDSTGGPLPEELHVMLQEMKMGKTRRMALENMTRRNESENLNSIVGALMQADKLGNPLGPVLKVQSQVLRIKRTQKAEKMANQAPVKLMFPLLFIFTSIFLVLFGNIIIKAVRGELL